MIITMIIAITDMTIVFVETPEVVVTCVVVVAAVVAVVNAVAVALYNGGWVIP